MLSAPTASAPRPGTYQLILGPDSGWYGLVIRRQPGEAAGQPTDPAEMETMLILFGGFEISSDR